MNEKPILFLDLKRENAAYEPELSDTARDIVLSGWYIEGEANKSFEKNWAQYCGTRFACGVSNGLDGIELLLRAYDIGPGDSVIVPANTYIATWLAISAVGAEILPIEPNEITFNIDIENVKPAIRENTKAVIGVHLYGRSLDFEPIRNFCDSSQLIFIEDAAQSHGARKNGIRVGAQGHAAAFSFYPGKNLGALGDGGAITTDDKDIFKKVRLLRNYGSAEKYLNELKGKNCRLDTLQAALLDLKLCKLDQANSSRRSLANCYLENLCDIDEVILPERPDDPLEHVWHLFVLRTKMRDELQQYLMRNNVQTLVHYPIPPYAQKAYSSLGYEKSDFPTSSRIHDECLSLPISPTHKFEEIERVCHLVRAFYKC